MATEKGMPKSRDLLAGLARHAEARRLLSSPGALSLGALGSALSWGKSIGTGPSDRVRQVTESKHQMHFLEYLCLRSKDVALGDPPKTPGTQQFTAIRPSAYCSGVQADSAKRMPSTNTLWR
jgi:hypothetical protein